MPKPNPFLLLTMVFWGYNFVSLKILNQVMEPGAILFWRFFVMWGILALICTLTKSSIRPQKEHRGRIWLAGFFSMGLYMILFLEGVKRAPAAESAIILASNPIIVAIIAMIIGLEPKSGKKLLGGSIALFGVALVVLGRPLKGSESNSHILGDVMLLASSVCWAVSVILAKPLSQEVKALPLFTMTLLGGMPVVVFYGLSPWFGSPMFDVQLSRFQPYHWMNFAQVAVGSGVIAMVCYYKGVQQLAASTAAMYQFMVPVLATIFAAILLNERLAWIQGFGLAVLILGLTYAFYQRKQTHSSDV
jgi:drug/metabolite transporter (DMT)-like permease